MTIKKEIDLDNFEAWIGAIDTLETVTRACKVQELEDYITDMYECQGLIPTETEINDFLWFESDYIYELLGIDIE